MLLKIKFRFYTNFTVFKKSSFHVKDFNNLCISYLQQKSKYNLIIPCDLGHNWKGFNWLHVKLKF